MTEVADGVGDLLSTVQRHLAEVDERMATLARTREHARTVEATLLRRSDPTDEELLTLLSGVGGGEPSADPSADPAGLSEPRGGEHLVSVFGLGAGRLDRDDEGTVVHAELHAGDGLLWLHQESPGVGLVSPATVGSTTVCMAVNVDDVDQHHERVAATGADIVYPPTRMPYGVREYGVRDLEGGLWSFMQDLEGDSDE